MLQLSGPACVSVMYVTAWTNGFTSSCLGALHAPRHAPLSLTNGAPRQRLCVCVWVFFFFFCVNERERRKRWARTLWGNPRERPHSCEGPVWILYEWMEENVTGYRVFPQLTLGALDSVLSSKHFLKRRCTCLSCKYGARIKQNNYAVHYVPSLVRNCEL